MNTTLRRTLLASGFICLAWLPLAGHSAGVTGSGHPATETRSVAEFRAIALAGSMDLEVRQGPQQLVQVQADDNLLPLLETVVDGGRLQVRWKTGTSLSTRSPVRVNVMLPRLAAVEATGSGDIRLASFETPALQLTLSGSGDAQLQGLSTEDLGIHISGSGDVAGSGKATRLKVAISGSGDVRLAELAADEVSVSIAGSGDASVNARKSLEVSVAGSGDVSYSGNPAQVRSSVAGSGSVTRR
jgi:hypothetical protein